MRTSSTALLAFLIAGCTSAPQFVQSGQGDSAATLEKYGSAFALCGLAFQGVCQARVHAVDARWVSQTQSTLKLDPGRHTVLVGCHFGQRGSPNGIKVTFQMVDMAFAERTTYKIQAEQLGDQCRTTIVNESDGSVVEGKSLH